MKNVRFFIINVCWGSQNLEILFCTLILSVNISFLIELWKLHCGEVNISFLRSMKDVSEWNLMLSTSYQAEQWASSRAPSGFPNGFTELTMVWEYSQEWAYASVTYSSKLKLEINFNNLKPLSWKFIGSWYHELEKYVQYYLGTMNTIQSTATFPDTKCMIEKLNYKWMNNIF